MRMRPQLLCGLASASVVVACWSTVDGEAPEAPASPAVAIADPTIACGGVGARSSSVNGHTHDICLPKSDLASPPSSASSYVTTTANGHAHLVSLESTELSAIQRGEVVRVTTAEEAGHVHAFVIARGDTLEP